MLGTIELVLQGNVVCTQILLVLTLERGSCSGSGLGIMDVDVLGWLDCEADDGKALLRDAVPFSSLVAEAWVFVGGDNGEAAGEVKHLHDGKLLVVVVVTVEFWDRGQEGCRDVGCGHGTE